jgi:hypothetical protein
VASRFGCEFRRRQRSEPRGQGVRSKAEQHQWLRFRQAGWSKSVLLLVLLHGIACRRTPHAVRLVMEKTGFNERFLNFLHPRRLDADMHVTPRCRGTPGSPVDSKDFLLLTCDQSQGRNKQQGHGNRQGPLNPSLTTGKNADHFKSMQSIGQEHGREGAPGMPRNQHQDILP